MIMRIPRNCTTTSTTTTIDHKEVNHYLQKENRQSAAPHSRRRHHLEHHPHQNPDCCQKAYLIMQLNISYFTYERMLLLMLLDRHSTKPGSPSCSNFIFLDSRFPQSTSFTSCPRKLSFNDQDKVTLGLAAVVLMMSLIEHLLTRNTSQSLSPSKNCSASPADPHHSSRFQCNYDDKMTPLC